LGLAAYAVPAKPLSSFVIQLSQMFFPLNTIKGGAFSPDAETHRIVVFSRPGPLVVLELGLPLAPTIFVLCGSCENDYSSRFHINSGESLRFKSSKAFFKISK
jgi:hypothetical protein